MTAVRHVNTLLDTYRDPSAPGGYKMYTAALKAADASQAQQGLQALQEPLSKIGAKVATRELMTDEADPGAGPAGCPAAGCSLGAAVGAVGASALDGRAALRRGAITDDIVDLAAGHPFYGAAEQAGIQTPPQRYYVLHDLRPRPRRCAPTCRCCWRAGRRRSRS